MKKDIVTLVFGLADDKELSITVDKDIEELSLPHRNIVTIPENIRELTGLKKLSLWDNQIVDASPLSGTTGLNWLDLSGNLIDRDQIDQLSKVLLNTNICI
jgi:Leucine-rich repeat (LRR) protein